MNLFKRLLHSLYSPESIAKLRFTGVGSAILYVFLLMLLSTLPSAIMLGQSFSSAVSGFEESMKDNLPSFKLENGVLQSPEKKPVVTEGDGFYFIFDPHDQISQDKTREYDDVISFDSDRAVVRSNGSEDAVTYTSLGADNLTKEDLLSALQSFDGMLPILLPVLYVISYILIAGAAFTGVSLLAVIGLGMKNSLRRRLQYKQLWVMSIYSITLPVAFFTVMSLLKTSVPFSFFIFTGVSMIMLYLSIKEVPQQK
ncbi:DUF1189 domain-containing protein [Fictibacillus aquaticus]|uniref:DUF1189 domain-containing protein n=1 Tax=Fictibacillus aquaticus TaxID=2021314 RepID=UPI0013FD5715|nr:DUF1189 domain-containing protein [Fictibacillus aquaticus]